MLILYLASAVSMATAETITINGGTIEATGGRYGSGIGGGNGGDGGTITINGGTVLQPAERLAALALAAATGAPAEQLPSAAELLPQPAVKNASGIGGGYMVSGGNISTGENGTAVIFASFIPTSNTTGWKGLIFNVNNGKIYGDSYTVEGALTIPGRQNADSRRRKNAQWWCKHYQQRYH